MRDVHAILSLYVARTIIGDIVNWGFQRRCCYGAVVEGEILRGLTESYLALGHMNSFETHTVLSIS